MKFIASKFFFLLFMSLTSLIIKNSHILAGIYFTFLKDVLDQNTKYGDQCKDREK